MNPYITYDGLVMALHALEAGLLAGLLGFCGIAAIGCCSILAARLERGNYMHRRSRIT